LEVVAKSDDGTEPFHAAIIGWIGCHGDPDLRRLDLAILEVPGAEETLG
jgi:hypothetical protein